MTPPAAPEAAAAGAGLRCWHLAVDRARARLAAWPAWRYHFFTAAAVLGFALFFHAPKFWVLRHPVPGSFEWDRALTFLAQCRDPFGGATEPAMRWRILPPLVAHALGCTNTSALFIPLLGVVAFLLGWSVVCLRQLRDRLDSLLLVAATATTGAVLTPLHWLGVNDGWYLLGLACVVGGRGPGSLLWPGLLAPWVDERFLLGLPLAFACRIWLAAPPSGWLRPAVCALCSILPYLAIRGGWVLFHGDPTSDSFVRTALAILPRYLAYGWIGWWHGLRAGWLLAVAAFVGFWLRWGPRGFSAATAALLLGGSAITVLAADLTRSTGLLLPLLPVGAVFAQRAFARPSVTTAILAVMAAFNALSPLLFVTYTKVIPTWPLPVELFRLLRSSG